MKLAFATLVIIFLLFPGIAFRYGYLKRDGLQVLSRTKFYIEFLFAFVISLLVHLGCFWIYEKGFNCDFDIDLLFSAVASDKPSSLEDSETKVGLFLIYNIFASICLFLFGWGLNELITRTDYEFSKNFQFLDYTGNWDRIFTFNRTQEEKDTIPTIDALVNINGHLILYTGNLIKYYINKDGYIDKLILSNVARVDYNEYNEYISGNPQNSKEEKIPKSEIKFPDDISQYEKEQIEAVFNKAVDKTQQRILKDFEIKPSHHFIIYGSTIKNLNIRYKLKGEDEN